jgi:hypothetical protein
MVLDVILGKIFARSEEAVVAVTGKAGSSPGF